MTAYYNEHDPHAAQWLRNNIEAGLCAPGVVDERDIRDVIPAELVRFTQCHFFAGIGVWSYAARLAGWPDDRPLWSGSAPCQPFSASGKRGRFDDERHLWPAWFHLIQVNRPDVIVGEQVASQDGLAWLDLVYSDLEGAGYAAGAVDLCAAGVGAPHIRQRLWLLGLADSDSGEEGPGLHGEGTGGAGRAELADGFSNGRLVDRFGARLEGQPGDGGDRGGRPGAARPAATPSAPGRLVDDDRSRRGELSTARLYDRGEPGLDPSGPCPAGGLGGAGRERRGEAGDRRGPEAGFPDARGIASPAGRLADQLRYRRRSRGIGHNSGDERPIADTDGRDARGPGPLNGFWRDADWLFCRDGTWRPAKSGTFPLVDGAQFRVGSNSPFEGRSRAKMLKGAGNAIVADAAAEFIRAVMEIVDGV